MVDIHHSNVCNAPLPFAFSWVDDYRNSTRFMFGLAQFDPAGGAPSQGAGAVFDAVYKTGPVKIKTTLKIVEWVQDELIRFDSVGGFRNYSTWQFAAEGADRTRITVDFVYELPGGIAGKVLGKALEPIIAPAVKHSDAELRKHVESDFVAGG